MMYEVVAGWTAVIDISLLSKGVVPTGTMAGMTVELILTNEDGVTMDTTGDVTIVDATNWIVRYTPDPTDLVVGTFYGRVKVTAADGAVAFFPSGTPDAWVVRKVSGVNTET